MRYSISTIGLVCVALGLAACSGGESATQPGTTPDFSGRAFALTIDTRTGQITVTPPAGALSARSGSSPSFSLIGSDGIAVSASSCNQFVPIPGTSRKRCTFQLTLTDRLQSTDLVTPRSGLPSAPAGVTGILVFPFTAGGQVSKGTATVTPSPDWDQAPINFFNDFGSCTASKTSDCYKWKKFTAPLYGGSTSEPRTVGFDVDANAGSVTAYIAVAADLRDNPLRTATLTADANLCGTATSDATSAVGAPTVSRVKTSTDYFTRRGFCGFPLSSLAGKQVVGATLRHYVYATDGSADPVTFQGPILIDHVALGSALQASDYDAAPLASAIAQYGDASALSYKEAEVGAAVDDDLVNSRAATSFRLRFTTEDNQPTFTQNVFFRGPGTPDQEPQLVVTYRTR